MMAKKKEELTRWHSDQVRRNVTFHFHQEMIAYCKSDVALLKPVVKRFSKNLNVRLASIPWPSASPLPVPAICIGESTI